MKDKCKLLPGGHTAAKTLSVQRWLPPHDLSTRKWLTYFNDIVSLELSTARFNKANSSTLLMWTHAAVQMKNKLCGSWMEEHCTLYISQWLSSKWETPWLSGGGVCVGVIYVYAKHLNYYHNPNHLIWWEKQNVICLGGTSELLHITNNTVTAEMCTCHSISA